MPKPTFHNLPVAKRDRILDAALDEFAAHPLPTASVNRIVRAAGIAKGSFYQYFDGLDDLYRFILFEHGADLKMAAMRAAGPPPTGGDLFDTMSYYALAGLRFGIAHPRIAAAARHLTAAPTATPMARELQQRSRTGVRHILREGIAAGAVRPDVDLDAAVIFTDHCLRATLDDVFRMRFGLDLLELCTHPERADAITDDQLLAAVSVVIDLLRHAIGTGSRAGATLDLDRLRRSVELPE